MTIGERIKLQRQKHQFSQEYVASAISSTKQAVYKYENEIVTNIPIDKIQKLADLFGVSPAYLMGWEENDDITYGMPEVRRTTRKRLPLLGNVACGEPKYADEQIEAYVSVEDDLDADFCLRAKGDSMINARIFDGDILFVKKQSQVDDGEIAVVLVDDETTVKRVYYDKENNVITLVPENPTYKPMRFMGAKLNDVRILGKVIAGQYSVS